MADPEITPSEPGAAGAGLRHEQPPDVHATAGGGDGPRLPEEFEEGGETVAEDTASGGAPEPAGEATDDWRARARPTGPVRSSVPRTCPRRSR